MSARALLAAGWYDAAAQLLATDASAPEAAAVAAATAARVLDLDAEDFHEIGSASSRPWAAHLAAAGFPRAPRAAERGALGSLVALYELMLEVLDIRARRGESLLVVVTAHLIGEYLPQLAWESRLGHGGDPLRLREQVGERWGTDDPTCSHSSALRATARRAVRACDGDEEGYLAYLARFHSRQGEALSVCAMNHRTVGPGQRPDAGQTCAKPCAWALQGDVETRADLDARVRLARLYVESPLVALRHHAPVGHFFGVPSPAQIDEAWAASWERLAAPWRDGGNPLTRDGVHGAPEADEALPGMSRLVSAVAGRTIGPGRVVRDIAADALAVLP